MNGEIVKRVLCVGDSIGLPRDEVDYGQTWIYKLQETFTNYNFIERFLRENTSEYLRSKDALEYYLPDIIIVQLGIVDCAPRLFSKEAIFPKLINKFPELIKTNLWKAIKKSRKRSPRNSHVSPIKFEHNLINYLRRCEILAVDKVVFLEIATPGSPMILKNPEIMETINLYNKIIRDVASDFSFVTSLSPLQEVTDDCFVDDGYHLNNNGFSLVYDIVRKELNEYRKRSSV